ncbi:MAG: zinc-ribbon domain-containing protein [Candidatus Bathyarchaeota archaeon]|nr:MAG: zinc-ribbon domain-containing protein [Candidatus Bathyarchaeota archaeon]
MKRKKKKELQGKISETSHYRKIAVAGLIIGIILIILGQLPQLPALFIIGYTLTFICTGATSFFTVLKWQHSKALEKEIEQETKPPPVTACPRCGTTAKANATYCPKCGKKFKAKE